MYINGFWSSGLNLVGFFEPLISNFGAITGNIGNFIPESKEYAFFYASSLLVLCIGISMVGASLFSRSGSVLFVILTLSVISIPFSLLLVGPFTDPKHGGAAYTGFSLHTLSHNLMPRFTSGAAGSQIKGKETFQNMFGIFFPATSGIFAGASMSGDLRKPSKSIPKGTLWGLLSTFVLYSLVILSIGCSVSRDLLHKDIQIIQNMNVSPYIILMGELSTSLYSALIGVVGASKLLQAIARDGLLPYAEYFGKGGGDDDNPIRAIVFTYLLTQLTLFFDINQIAVFITMAYLMTFVVTNLACFLLKIASAPNFRPSFRYFNSYTAGFGALAGVLAMFVADGVSASAMIIVLILLFLFIHYISPPKPWGDVSQSLIYHQVRKYLLRLRQDHVKFWRPQILLLVDNPRTSWSLIHFCNHLKKGGLYILGHVMVTEDFQESFPEMKKQQDAWNELRTTSNIKGFVQVAAGPDVVWGARNVYMGSGLGGMKPNITVLGFFEKKNHYPCDTSKTTNGIPGQAIDVERLPTDICRKEPSISVTQWVHIIEDLLTMQANIAIAKGFPRLEFPSMEPSLESKRGYIDLYPIQMSAQIVDEEGQLSAMTTNFDTYTLILQMGAILRTVPAWKRNHNLRVVVFVEFEEDLDNERERIKILLEKLRINAEVLVLCLNSGSVGAYETIMHGRPDRTGRVSKSLSDDEWWQELQEARRGLNTSSSEAHSRIAEDLIPSEGNSASHVVAGDQLQQFIDRRQRRYTLSGLQRLGVSLSMHTSHLSKRDINNAVNGYYDDYEFDESGSDSELDSFYRKAGTRKRSKTTSAMSSLPESQAESDVDSIPPQSRKRSLSVGSRGSESGYDARRTPLHSGPPSSAGSRGNSISGSPLGGPVTTDYFGPNAMAQYHGSGPHKRTPSGASQATQSSIPGGSNTVGLTPSGATTARPQRPAFVRTPSGLSEVYNRPESDDSKATSPRAASPAPMVPQSAPGTPGGGNRSGATTPVPGKPPKRPDLISRPSLMKTLSRSSSIADLTRAQKLRPNFSGQTIPNTKVLDDADTGSRTIMFEADKKGGSTKSSSSQKRVYDLTDERTPLLKVTDEEGGPSTSSYTRENSRVEGRGISRKPSSNSSGDESTFLSFNDLPAKAQHVILNDMMHTISKDSAVIFSTLPAPPLGTHKSEEDSLEYVNSLELWCQDLPPVVLLHSQSMTVTTAL